MSSCLSKVREVVTSGIIILLSKFLSEKRVGVLTYEDVVSYFVRNKPEDRRIAKGSLLIEEHEKGYLTIWTFLDADNEVVCDHNATPYGRKLLARDLDRELREAFNQTQLLIFE